jgi:hypothetical protein
MNYEIKNIFKTLKKFVSKEISLTSTFEALNTHVVDNFMPHENLIEIGSKVML